MPGIFGFITNDGVEARGEMLRTMLSAAHHPSGREHGSLVEEQGLAVGWTAHPNSYASQFPIWNEAGDLGLLLAGEHFGATEQHASQFLAAYEREGANFLRELNGIFSGIVIDRRASKVLLFNDRYGLGRIYWHESSNGFFFASEARPLFAVCPETRSLDLTGFGEHLACGCPLENRTLFSGISLLPGAAVWDIANPLSVERSQYFRREEWEELPELDAGEYVTALKQEMARIVPFYSEGSVELSLTGGLDSRMILAAAGPSPAVHSSHTFAGMYRECADVRLAKEIAQVAKLKHRLIPVDRGYFKQFPELARQSILATDGAMDVTGSVEIFANRLARQGAGVRLTGNYGSELLRSNVAFKARSMANPVFAPDLNPAMQSAFATYGQQRSGSLQSFITFKQVPWFHFARLACEQSELTVRSPFLDNAIARLAYQKPRDEGVNRSVAHRFITDLNPALGAIPTDRGVRPDRDTRPTRLRNFVQEFMPRVEYMFDYGMPQWLARLNRVFEPLQVDRLFLGRQKFYHFRRWYRAELAPYVREVLLDPSSLARPFIDRRRVEFIVNSHTSGKGNYTLELHKLLTAELIHRELLDSSPVPKHN